MNIAEECHDHISARVSLALWRDLDIAAYADHSVNLSYVESTVNRVDEGIVDKVIDAIELSLSNSIRNACKEYNYEKKKSVEYCVWNKGWRDIDFLRVALKKNAENQLDYEPLQKILMSVPRNIVNTIGGNIPFDGGFELKAILNSELRERQYINYEI